MTEPLSTAVAGLNAAASRIAKAANVIANASLTPEDSVPPPPDTGVTPVDITSFNTKTPDDIASAFVAIISDSAVYGANAKVISAVQKNTKALIDTLA